MAVLRRFISEFWLAFVLGLIWAILRAWPLRAEWSWAGAFVANFGAAFFFRQLLHWPVCPHQASANDRANARNRRTDIDGR